MQTWPPGRASSFPLATFHVSDMPESQLFNMSDLVFLFCQWCIHRYLFFRRRILTVRECKSAFIERAVRFAVLSYRARAIRLLGLVVILAQFAYCGGRSARAGGGWPLYSRCGQSSISLVIRLQNHEVLPPSSPPLIMSTFPLLSVYFHHLLPGWCYLKVPGYQKRGLNPFDTPDVSRPR